VLIDTLLLSSLGDFSVKFWLKADATHASYAPILIEDKAATASVTVVQYFSTTNRIQFSWYNTAWYGPISDNAASTTNYSHIVITYTAATKTADIFVDLGQNTVADQANGIPTIVGAGLRLMRTERDNVWGKGSIGGLTISPVVWTPAQVAQDYARDHWLFK